jgi:hypothetical protein
LIEKLNFYDIFGYLLPGIVFATLLWLPFGLFLHIWPSDLSGALIVVVLSYIIGHILQDYAVRLLPFSTATDRFGRERLPSDLMLDVSITFTAETKNMINQLSQKYFDLNLEPQDNPTQPSEHQETIAMRRRDAFFQARSVLLKDRKTSYWEQFEGLSALMRNVSAACAIVASYFLGWGVAFSRKAGVFFDLSQADSWAKWGAVLILFFAVKVVQFSLPPARRSEEQSIREENDYKQEQKNIAIALRLSLLCIFFLTGMLLCLGRKDLQPPNGPFIMLGMALASVIVSIRCFVASKRFAWLFAENIWREFGAQIDKPSPPAPPDLV